MIAENERAFCPNRFRDLVGLVPDRTAGRNIRLLGHASGRNDRSRIDQARDGFLMSEAAAAICLAILVSRQFCKCCSYLAEAGLLDLLSLIFVPLVDLSATERGPLLTGSIPLRI